MAHAMSSCLRRLGGIPCSALRLVLMFAFVALIPTVIAQTETSTTPPSTTTQNDDIPGSMSLECWRVTSTGGGVASIPIPSPDADSIQGAKCWEVYSVGGGTARVPVTATSVDFAPTAQAAESSESSGTNVINGTVKVIVPALVGSLFAVVLVVVGTTWYLRKHRRQKMQASRAQRWATTHNSGWALKQGRADPVQISVQRDLEDAPHSFGSPRMPPGLSYPSRAV